MRSRHTSGKIDSQIWILVMSGAFFSLSLAIAVNRAVGTNSKEGLIMRICVQSVFLSLWAWYTFDVCRTDLRMSKCSCSAVDVLTLTGNREELMAWSASAADRDWACERAS